MSMNHHSSGMKVVYLMMVHQNPRLLERAVRALSGEGCAFYIHVDRKSDIRAFSGIGGGDVHFSEPRIPVYWSEFSNVEAELQLIRQALGDGTSFDYFVLMQGSDYPLRSGAYIRGFLEGNRGGEFISLAKMPAPGFPLSKINTVRYTSDKPVRRFVFRALAKLGMARRDYRKHLGLLEPYAGDACWALTRDACRHIVEFAAANRKVVDYFRRTHVPEESFFHTILGNSSFHPRVRKSLLYRNWPAASAHHPAVLSEEHVKFFEGQREVVGEDQFGTGEMLFARKFTDNSMNLIDRIDVMIRQKDGQG
jgi:hypothetical protein